MDEPREAWSDNVLTCPHCGYVRTDDLYDWKEGDVNETECNECERPFKYTVMITYSFSSTTT